MFNPADWFWVADDGRVFASQREVTVDEQDEAFVQAAAQGRVTRWPVDDQGQQTSAALQAVLSAYQLYMDLPAFKAARKAAIDVAAEAERLKYITPGAGQAMTYQAKVEEARRLMALADPTEADVADFPMLSAEIGITAPSLVGVADVVLVAYRQWIVICATIEAVRQAAKSAIEAAPDIEAARAVSVTWPAH